MTRHIPDAVFWALVVVALAAAVLVVRERQITTALRRRIGLIDGGARQRDEEIWHLASVRLPALAEAVPDPGARHEALVGTPFGQHVQAVIDQFEDAVRRTRTRSDESARASLMATMRALQGLANEQQTAISDMQDRHDNPQVLQDLLEIDHTNSQFGRRAQVVAVLCGAWPGRQRSASPLRDVVRGATSRIRDYLRVEVHGQADISVVDRAVEPAVLAIAELLDNAARHSPSHTMVQVKIQRTHNGAVVVIDDGGVGMNDNELAQAATVLSGQQALDITRLSDPPQFGFPVIGMLAARYGFRVNVDSQSPYGGVRAVVFIPAALLTTVVDEPSASSPALSIPDMTEAPATPGGLPKRRRRQPASEAPAAGTAPRPRPSPVPQRDAPQPAATQGRAPKEAAALMGALQRGTRSGRAATRPTPPAPPQPPTPPQSTSTEATDEGTQG